MTIGKRCPTGLTAPTKYRVRLHLSQALRSLGVPQRDRRWRANIFLPNIGIHHRHPKTRHQEPLTEKLTVCALTTIHRTDNEHCAPLMADDVCG